MSRESRDQALFDRIAARYARKDTVLSSSLARREQLLLALRPVLQQTKSLGMVVDVGCGVGAPAQYLAGLYDRYIGVDQAEALIEAARVLYQAYPQAEFIAANIKEAAIPPHSADLILSDGGLHHMTNLDEVMEILRHLAKPGGWFVAREPQNGNPLLQAMRWVRGRTDDEYSAEQSYFSPQEMHQLCARHGLTDVTVTRQGFFVPPFAQVIINPQALSVPLSRLSVRLDKGLDAWLPNPLKRLSFNLVAIGRFPIV